MRIKKLALSSLLVLGLLPARAGAIDPAAGTSGASFLKIGIGSARSMAMGRAYVALAEGADAITWNPAGLGLAQQREFTYSYLRYIQGIDSPLFIAYAHPLGRSVLGLNLAYLSVDGFDVRDINGKPLNSTEVRVQDGFATVSLARSFWFEKLFVGGSLKVVHENNDGTIQDNIVGDFGALMKPNSFVTFGFASQNMGTGSSEVVQITRGGAAFQFFGVMTASMELQKTSDGPPRLAVGVEFTLPEDLLQVGQIHFRAGFRGTDDLGQLLEDDRNFLYPLVGSPKLSFGIGVYTAQAFGYGIAFDYAIMSLGALGTANMMSMKVKF